MAHVTDQLNAALAERYRIERELGQGGMATVYLARDIKHDRKVALKVLRPELAAVIGADRFLAEIKTTANLQHPHILPLHDSGEAGGLVFYVMPYVEGESLRDRLTRETQLPVDEAVRLTVEVASALDYAHRKGVVHRDIKPENILLHDGRAVVADFGIALAVSRSDGGTRMTETGMSLGTPHYMSPEQAMGEREITAKSDVYALGCVLYEMLTGEPPFTGPTAQAIVARVMTEEPRSLTLQRRTVPPHVEAAVNQALAKLPADRFAGAAQFAEALANPTFGAPAGRRAAGPAPHPVIPPSRRPALVPALAATAIAATALAAWGWLRPRPLPPPPPMERFTLRFPPGFEASDQAGSSIAVSPDGSRIVYVGLDAQRQQWLFSRGLDRVEPVPIAGTNGARQPFFSPDGEWIGFEQEGRIRKVSLAGGAVVTVCEAPLLQGASWGPDQIIVFASRGRLMRVAAAGGEPVLVAAPDSGSAVTAYRFPDLLPDGRTALVTQVEPSGPSLAAVSLADGRVTALGQPGMSPSYVNGGIVAFAQGDGTLFAAPFDAGRARLTGPPQPIAEQVRIGPAQVAKLGMARTGTLAYLSGGGSSSRQMVIADRQGRVETLPIPPDRYRAPRFSPEGRRIAVGIEGAGPNTGDVWVYDLDARNLTRLTFDTLSFLPTWMPGGQRVAFSRWRTAGANYLSAIATDGSGTPETLLVRAQPIFEAEFTADGRTMVFREHHPETSRDIWTAPMDSVEAAVALLRTPFNERQIALTPDGRWLAYVSNETGADEVYLRRPQPGSPRWRVSTGGGLAPRWAGGGRELFFWSGDSLVVVPVDAGPQPRIGAPRTVLVGRYHNDSPNNILYDVSSDGSRIVLVRSESQASEGGEELHVVLHWPERFRGRER
jgi:eukaryotic-like serine/threonine-protein kinase